MTQDNPKTVSGAEVTTQKYGVILTPQDYAAMQAIMDERQRHREK